MKTQRYYSIDAAKFAFTLMIAVYHFWIHYGQPPRGGFIAVEFFFIASGFFLMKQWEERTAEITPLQYTWRKIKKFYPHYFFSFLAMFLYRHIFNYGSDFYEMAREFLGQATEIFMLYGTILSDEKTFIYNSMTWYLSVLLLTGYALWAVLEKHQSALLKAAPVAAFWIYAYMAYALGTTNNWRTHIFEIFNYAAFRGIAGMLLGIVAYRAHKTIVSSTRNWIKVTGGGGGLPLRYLHDCLCVCSQLQMVP